MSDTITDPMVMKLTPTARIVGALLMLVADAAQTCGRRPESGEGGEEKCPLQAGAR